MHKNKLYLVPKFSKSLHCGRGTPRGGGGGGNSTFMLTGGGGAAVGRKPDPVAMRSVHKKYTLHVTIIDTLLKMFIMHTLSQYCTVACARSRACHKHCGLEALGSNPVINGVVRQ